MVGLKTIAKQSRWAHIAITICLLHFASAAVEAHQPFCEFADLSAEAPWQVPDPAISYAYFGNIYPA